MSTPNSDATDQVFEDPDFRYQSFPLFLFNSQKQVRFQSENFFSYVLLKESESAARVTFFPTNDAAISPLRSPFGSIEFTKEITLPRLKFLIHEVEADLAQKGFKKIQLTAYPYCYDFEKSNLLTKALLSSGYRVLFKEMNFHLPAAGNFEDFLHQSLRRRLKKTSLNFSVSINPDPDLEEFFTLLETSRFLKGHPLTIDPYSLAKLYSAFKEELIYFEIRDNNKLIAASFGVKVSPQVLYYFLPADDYTYKSYSPMVLIIKEMFEYCKTRDFSILDLGIATSREIPNWGLIRFKRNLGGKESLKLSFVKHI